MARVQRKYALETDMVMEALEVPETFELRTQLVNPGGHVADIRVHENPATLHLEDLWIKNVTINMGLVNTSSTPTLLKLIAEARLEPTAFATYRFSLD